MQQYLFINKMIKLNRQIYQQSRRYYSSVSGEQLQISKPFSEIPTVNYWKLMKESIIGGKYYQKPVRDVLKLMREEYGGIFRIPAILHRPVFVVTFDAEDFEKVYRAEGAWPVRYGFESLDYYRRTQRPEIYGDFGSLLFSHGEKWSHIRTVVNPILMQSNIIKKYTAQIDEIAKEFLEVMRKIKNENSEMPGDFSNYIASWFLESVTAIGLERRLNVFDENSKDEKAKQLLGLIRKFFERIVEVVGSVSIRKFYQTKNLKEWMNIYDSLTGIILHYIDQTIEDMKKDNSIDELEDSIIRKLLKVNKRIAIVVSSDLMMAGIDTTAGSVLYVLYLLAINPEKQDILRQEILKILPEKNTKLAPENMKNMPYLKSVIKETMRMYPIVSGNIRQTTKDVVLSGYRIPAPTYVIMQPMFELMNEKYYPQPEKFIPERWLREKPVNCPQAKYSNPFTFLPFSFGVRSCIGKRIAELEMETLVANIIRNFKLEWHYPDIKIKSTFVNLPDSEMRFKVTDV